MTIENIEPENKLFYRASSGTNTGEVEVISLSALGIEREDQQFIEGLSFIFASSVEIIDKKYSILHGRRKDNHNLSNQLTLHFSNAEGSKHDLVLRVHNEGVASTYNDIPVICHGRWQTTEYWMTPVGGAIILLNELSNIDYSD